MLQRKELRHDLQFADFCESRRYALC